MQKTAVFRPNTQLTGTSFIVLLLVALGMVQPAIALEFRCESNGDVRFLSVDIPGEKHLCEVGVTYQSTGERRAIWHANVNTLFCSTKAYELREKYIQSWEYTCEEWPDSDGIDKLSPTHRAILDTQLKLLINEGKSDPQPFRVTSLKTAASTLLDGQPSVLALQFFLSTGKDITKIIMDDGDEWHVFASIPDLASWINDKSVDIALIESVTDAAALQVSTSFQDDKGSTCVGQQVLMIRENLSLQPRTPHRFVCDSAGL